MDLVELITGPLSPNNSLIAFNSAISPTGTALEDLLKAADDEFFDLIDDGSGKLRDQAKARAIEYDS